MRNETNPAKRLGNVVYQELLAILQGEVELETHQASHAASLCARTAEAHFEAWSCGFCAKWLPPEQGSLYGECQKIDGMEQAMMIGGLAGIDASGDFGMEASGSLRTRDTFGCIMHEPKKEEA